jgi:magnesium-transporting ATPase (P-type)
MCLLGDKLETAKNIGLACNLIDPDMIPNFKSSENMDNIVSEYQNARLLEITGQWANLAEDREQMGKLFDNFDLNSNGRLSFDELSFILKALKCSIPDQRIHDLMQQDDKGEKHITKQGFIELMESTRLSKYEAVKYDIDQAVATYNSIQDHTLYPVSILIDRSAFQVMFPGKAVKVNPAANIRSKTVSDKKEESKFSDTHSIAQREPTEEELEALRSKFFKLYKASKSVVFARAEPAMKKRMVTEIQAREPKAITLAIGDGANDTDMITAAHVGVGIAGVEGTAATNSADYAIGTFRYLHTLLFVHGFYSYQRVSKLVNFIFYKAALCSFSMFLFGFFSAFSGQQFFDDPPYQLYNVMYTALPILFVAVLDKTLPMRDVQNNPLLYKQAKNAAFTRPLFFSWIFRSMLHTCVFWFICYAAVATNNISGRDGSSEGIWFFATIVYYCCVLTPTFIIIYEMTEIGFLQALTIFLSVLALYIVTLIINALKSIDPNLYGIVEEIYASPNAWLTIILAVGSCLLLELAYRGYQRESRPYLYQIYQEKIRFEQLGHPEALAQAKQPLVQPMPSKLHLPISDDPTAEHSKIGSDSQYSHLKAHMVRAMLRFRNMTGGQFDSAAQAHLQQHDQYVDNAGRVHAASNATTLPDRNQTNILNTAPAFSRLDNSADPEVYSPDSDANTNLLAHEEDGPGRTSSGSRIPLDEVKTQDRIN